MRRACASRRIDISNLSDDPGAICSGGSSGFGAVNLAWLKRSRRMILLGFDYDTEKGHADLRAFCKTDRNARPRGSPGRRISTA